MDDIDTQIQLIKAGITPSEPSFKLLCSQAQTLLGAEDTLIEVQAPVTIVGDLHGQFNDLLNILELGGCPSTQNYVFLGDYVNRGKNSVSIVSLLFALKIKYPHKITLLRGNHESIKIGEVYGSKAEIIKKIRQRCSFRLHVRGFQQPSFGCSCQQEGVLCAWGAFTLSHNFGSGQENRPQGRCSVLRAYD